MPILGREPIKSNDYSTSLTPKQAQILTKTLQKLSDSGISQKQLSSFLHQSTQPRIIPLSIFEEKLLAPLQSLVKYLKEHLDYSNREIAATLGKDSRTIWQTYHVAQKKLSEYQTIKEGTYDIPLSVFEASALTIFEQLVQYLHIHYSLTFSDIAKLLNRDQRTIWTVYNRSQKKGGAE